MADAQKQDAQKQAAHQALVQNISSEVSSKITPELSKLSEQLAKLHVGLNACTARLETLEHLISGSNGVKRSTRSSAAAKSPAKSGGAKKAAAKKGDDKSKVTNALLYFRYMFENDIEDARDTYGTPENIEEAEKDATVQKRDKAKDAGAYWSAIGAAIWKSSLSEEEKATVRAQHLAWKEQAVRDEADGPLDDS